MYIMGVYPSEISSTSFTVRVKVSMSLCVSEDSASGLLHKRTDGCSICFSSYGRVDKGRDRWQGRHPGGKVHEPISGCQAATVLSLLRNRNYPVSGA